MKGETLGVRGQGADGLSGLSGLFGLSGAINKRDETDKMNQTGIRATRYERDWRETRDGRSADVRSGGGSQRVPIARLSREKEEGEDLQAAENYCGTPELHWSARVGQHVDIVPDAQKVRPARPQRTITY